MREILFRGKRVATATFVHGFLVVSNDRTHNIVNENGNYWVMPDTVGQFTGLFDKRGVKIFEGDIVRVVSTDYMGFDEIGKVEFQNGCFGVSYFPKWERKYGFGHWHFHRIGQVDKWQDMSASGEMRYTYEIVGNIHDTPDLLEVKHE